MLAKGEKVLTKIQVKKIKGSQGIIKMAFISDSCNLLRPCGDP
jgi:hypothetical protein